MRRPTIYSRSAPRSKASANVRDASRIAALRRLAQQLSRMTDVADAIGSADLGDRLDDARLEAERQIAEEDTTSGV